MEPSLASIFGCFFFPLYPGVISDCVHICFSLCAMGSVGGQGSWSPISASLREKEGFSKCLLHEWIKDKVSPWKVGTPESTQT